MSDQETIEDYIGSRFLEAESEDEIRPPTPIPFTQPPPEAEVLPPAAASLPAAVAPPVPLPAAVALPPPLMPLPPWLAPWPEYGGRGRQHRSRGGKFVHFIKNSYNYHYHKIKVLYYIRCIE